MPTKQELLKKIKDEVVALRQSPLYEYRVTNQYFPVIGEGNHDARIMFIGEAPGEKEAQQGRPFVGAAGRILNELLASVNIPREQVYITNVVKDRPPGNRDPKPDEIALYAPFLKRQIDIIKPAVIATLGRFSMAFIFDTFGMADQLTTIGKMHGQEFSAQASYGPVKIVPLYHPAVALYSGSSKTTLLNDMQLLTKYQ